MEMSTEATMMGDVRLADVQALYDRHRFLEAWKASEALWRPETDADALPIEALILAARLAIRLGGWRLSRNLFQRARRREPGNPLVRYFTDHLRQPRTFLLDELVAFENNESLDSGDSELEANWLASHAYSWAKLRNRARARDLLARAHALCPGSVWIHGIEADVHGFADDWDAALKSAERACELDGDSAWAQTSRATALMNLGRIEEAARRLASVAGGTQSSQLVQTACWYQCAIAEVRGGREREEALAAARRWAQRIEPLTPLADREFRANAAKAWLDIAQLAGDHEAMEQWTTEARSPFHRQVLANLKQNPGGKRIELPHRRSIQKHLECVPTSVASALSATGIDISIEQFAAEVTFGGTAEWAAADWLRAQGLHVRMFSATAEIAARLIEAGIGFVVSWDDDESGHAVAVIGIDHAAGIVLVHDPVSFRSAEYLLRVFDAGASPLGVLSMAAVRAERAHELDAILPREAELVEAGQEHQKALALYGPSAAQRVVAEIAGRFPDHAGTEYLHAVQDIEEGRMGQALACLRRLFDRYPNAPTVRLRLMHACRAMGDSALLRQTLKSIVERGAVPGVEAQSEWIRPHPRYVCEYADILRSSSETRQAATAMVRSVLDRNWASANAWHVLADVRWSGPDRASALLAYSIASFLAAHDEHYARAYAEVLCRCHRSEEGFRWLRERAEEMGGTWQGVSTWISWIAVLEEHGHPERAMAACDAALQRHGASAQLLGFTVPFLARMGRWDEAETQLRTLASSQAKRSFHEAATAFHRMRGEKRIALEDAEAWVAEVPRSMQARYALLDLVCALEGQGAATMRAAAWMRAHTANEDFEQVFCHYAENSLDWRKLRVLRERTKRNGEDGWAWRELVFCAIAIFEKAYAKRGERLRPTIEKYFAEADRLAPDDPATMRAHGLWHEARGDWQEAVRCYVEAIRREPEHFYAYRRAWECAARRTEPERRALWALIEPVYLDNAGHLPNSLEMMRLLTHSFGAGDTERIVEGWRSHRPDDPNVLEAAADLLLDNGHGRSDAVRALELLRAAVERFPYHAGLRFSLATACRACGESQGAKEVFEELVRRQPENVSALLQLAWIQQREGQPALALKTIDRATYQEPQDTRPLDTRAQILMEESRHDEACAVLDDALRKLPNSIRMYERSIELFFQCGRADRAVHAARQGVEAFPHGAYLWLLLGKTLSDAPQFAAPGEMEACLRKSVGLNRGLYDAADRLAAFLAEQSNAAEAVRLLDEVERTLPDPSAALGRKAWIKRQSGKKQEAVIELAAAVRSAPWYSWGWNVLLTWLDEDGDLSPCRELLDTVPAQKATDVGFRQRRRMLLDKNKVDVASSDAEWEQLLSDFPEEVPLHLHRFDSLLESGRADEAASVLRRVVPIAADNVFVQARLVQVDVREGKHGDALKQALDVCFAPAEQSPWPVNHVWEQMRAGGMEAQFAEKFLARMREGGRPTRRSLARDAGSILDRASASAGPKWLRNSVLSHTYRQLTRLLRIAERSSWFDGLYAADLMAVLNKGNYHRLTLACWNRMQAKGVELDTGAWAQAGRALLNLRRRGAARRLLQDWRSRTGVEMWMLSNYVLCISRLSRERLDEVIATCRDALALLAHDHCARYLACMGAEALAMAGDREGLLVFWQKYARYFEGLPARGEFFPQSQRYLLYDLPVSVRLLQQNDGPGYRRTIWTMWLKRLWSQQIRVRGKWLFILLLRLAVPLWLLAAALSTLFK